MAYEHVIIEIKNQVGVITLNRPKALNALCGALMDELETVLDELEENDAIGCIVVTGSEKAADLIVRGDHPRLRNSGFGGIAPTQPAAPHSWNPLPRRWEIWTGSGQSYRRKSAC